MLFLPFALPIAWVLNLLSAALLAAGLYLLWAWYFGALVGTGYLVAGLILLLLTFAGRWIVLLFRPQGPDEPSDTRAGAVHRLPRPDGAELHVEVYGPPDRPPLLLTHGWGTNGTEWYYAKRHLADRFRLIVWDLPGLGRSAGPRTNDYSLEKMARDLEAVLTLADDRPAILLGHSIGGMITLTFCRLFPQHLGRRVAGLVLADTTYTNPVRTTTASGFFRAAQRPLLEPLLHLTVWLAPLVWLMNWLSYLNGSAHLLSMLTGFAGRETRGQLDFATRFNVLASPAVVGRGGLATFAFDETATLGRLPVPVLVVTADRDRITIPEASAYMHRTVPAGELVELRPAGHMSILEQPDRFTAAVAAFAAAA